MLNVPAAALGLMDRPRAENEIRARVRAVALGGVLILARVLSSHKMPLRASDRGFSRRVMRDGYRGLDI